MCSSWQAVRGWLALMHEAVYWVGFIGAWFLFAGPIYQSALELREEDEARLSMQRLLESTAAPAPVSPWWWLLPPVAIFLILRRRGRHVQIVDAAMSDDDRQAIGHYQAVARGWWFVGLGAWLIFLKEGWELAEHREWSPAGYWIVVVAMTLLAAGGAGAGGDRSARARSRPRRGGSPTTSPGAGPTSAAAG
jgi:hypothetical protein